MSIARLARPEIRALEPYKAAQQVDDTIRLNANEAPWRNDAADFRRPLNRYPEIRPSALRTGLAERFGCDAARLLVTRGTSEAIDLLIRTFCRAGIDNIVTTPPSFSMYAHYATIQGAALREVPTDPYADFEPDPDAVLDACCADTRLVFLCSPNNPTGSSVPRAVLERLLAGRGDQSVVVVDEAYIEFSSEPSAVDLLDTYPNLVVLRTLSKALAYAGARCGAVMGPREVVSMLDAVQAPYALATPVVECVEDALRDEWLAEADRRVAETIEQRERLVRELGRLAIVNRIWPSEANFLLVEFSDVDAVLAQCALDRILLRHFGGSLQSCVRISVGSVDENDRLVESLQRIGGEPGA